MVIISCLLGAPSAGSCSIQEQNLHGAGEQKGMVSALEEKGVGERSVPTDLTLNAGTIRAWYSFFIFFIAGAEEESCARRNSLVS